jgi:hypothetical protein
MVIIMDFSKECAASVDEYTYNVCEYRSQWTPPESPESPLFLYIHYYYITSVAEAPLKWMNQLMNWSFIDSDLWCVFGCTDGHVSWHSLLSESDFREITIKMG